MKIFLDSADINQVKKWLPVISGVTTNPSILEKDKGDVIKISKLISPMPISVEACGDFETDAYYWSGMIPNSNIKIPLLGIDGSSNIGLIKRLSDAGIPINCTALFSLSQIILAQKAGAKYVSLFAGRVDDEGGDSYSIIRDSMNYLEGILGEHRAELIVGSIRTVGNVLDAIRAGADIVTIPPPILEKMMSHEYSLKTVRQFEEAYGRILGRDKTSS
jgi:transaldolase